jgi:hypothetical protein
VTLRALAALTTSNHHKTPTGWLLVLVIALALLYLAVRTGRLGKLRGLVRGLRARGELRGVRVGPAALVPTALLLIVVAVLLITH